MIRANWPSPETLDPFVAKRSLARLCFTQPKLQLCKGEKGGTMQTASI